MTPDTLAPVCMRLHQKLNYITDLVHLAALKVRPINHGGLRSPSQVDLDLYCSADLNWPDGLSEGIID